jgi:hypothetical protein
MIRGNTDFLISQNATIILRAILMRIDLIALCDAAVEVNGRLHVLGTIDYFWTDCLPYVHPQCALAVRLRFDPEDYQRKRRLNVQLIDADGRSIATEFEKKLVPSYPKDDDIPGVRHLVLDLESLSFESYGPYAVRIEVDGQELASLPFSVVPAARIRSVKQE